MSSILIAQSNQPLMSDGYKERIAVVLVTYQPDLVLLNESLLAIAQQVEHIILVDNGSANIEAFNSQVFESYANFDLIKLPKNIGVAGGFNVGIRRALEQGFCFVLLMDQDSVPQADMVQQLYQNLVDLRSSGLQVAATGPRFFDIAERNLSHFISYGIWGTKQLKCEGATPVVLVDTLISSGMLISLKAVEQIGLMDELLFIDHVDTEWCLRAKSKGWSVFGVCSAYMSHSLGNKRQKVWFLRWRNVSFHSPTRYYYMFRNSVLLMRRPYIPIVWKLCCFNQLCMLFGYFVFLAPNRRLNLNMMWRGLLDGWRGITGKLKSESDSYDVK